MNIDIKNSLDSLLVICKTIMTSSQNIRDIDRIMIEDILSFIDYISNEGLEDRISLFKITYLNTSYSDLYPRVQEVETPKFFMLLFKNSKEISSNTVLHIESLYISTIYEIGKYYSLNKQDKNTVDKEKFMNYLKMLKEYTKLYKETQNIAFENLDNSIIKNEEIHNKTSIDSNKIEDNPEEESLEDLLNELNELIGLAGVKEEVSSLVNILKINKLRESRGFKVPQVSKHLVFLGNPGTGKTTVARLLSKIYKKLGVLEKGQLVEVDRSGLVAGYVGQTAIKTQEKIDEAMGGVLFIDEAYTLAKGENDFGQESIDTLLKAMEDQREDFVVIVAGYSKPMNRFLESNPGLKSRFNKSITFEDYSPNELLDIFELFCKLNDMRLSSDARDYLTQYLNKLSNEKSENFANGREMRNLFEKAFTNQANRLSHYNNISDEELNIIKTEDIKNELHILLFIWII